MRPQVRVAVCKIGPAREVSGEGWFADLTGQGGAKLVTFGPHATPEEALAEGVNYCRSVRLRVEVEGA